MNIEQTFTAIKVFLNINEEETKPFLILKKSTVVYNQTVYALPIFFPKMLKVNKKLTFQY